eukprot:7487957-Alexandrium_andersonii.AAC.1
MNPRHGLIDKFKRRHVKQMVVIFLCLRLVALKGILVHAALVKPLVLAGFSDTAWPGRADGQSQVAMLVAAHGQEHIPEK